MYPPANLVTGGAATVVLGQTSFTTSGSGTTATTLNAPARLTFDSSGNLWLGDQSNHRILMYPPANLVTGGAATVALGQSSFTSNSINQGGPIGPNTLHTATGPVFDSAGNLWVADVGNHRVVKFQDLPVTTLTSSNTIASGSNSFSLGSLTAGFTASGTWSDVNLFIQRTDSNPTSSSVADTTIGKFYEVVTNSPDILSSRTIDITYTNGELGSLIESSLLIYRFDGSSWSALATAVNTATNTASASTPGYSIFVLAGTPPPTPLDTISISDNIGAAIRPKITSVVASDPGADDAVFNAGDTITVTFSQPTNQIFRGTTNSLTDANVNAIFTFSPSLSATTFTGRWLDPSTLRITVTATTDSTPVGLTLSVKPTSGLTHAAAPSPAENDAVSLTGDFGTKQGPSITAFVADDTKTTPVAGFDPGDTLTLRFSEATNQAGFAAAPTVLTKEEVDSIFTFSQSLGATYTGQWTSPSTFVITIGTTTTGFTAAIDVTTATVIHPNLKDAAGTSLASTSTSPALSGSFGIFIESETIAPQGTATTTLPTGQTLQVTTPAGAATTTITVTRVAADEVPDVPANLIGFVGNVFDVTSSNSQCAIAPGCTISFTFDESDLAAAGISSPTLVAVTHDKNNDGDFDDAGETLATTVVPTSPPGPFTATATDQFTSKFAVGGIRSLFLGGLSGEFAPPSFSSKAFAENEYPLTINGLGYKLDQYSNTIPTITLETGKPVQIKTLLYDSGGVSTIQHLAMYMNLHGMTRDIQYSDTYIIYDKSSSTIVSDPNGFFDDVKVTTTQVGNKLELSHKLELTFDITFAKPMEKSDIIFRMWDDRRNNADTKVLDAIQVVGQETTSSTTETVPTTQETIQKQETAIPSWIKNNAGWWSEGSINDSDFVSGIQYLIKEGIMIIPETESGETTAQQIPPWIKNNAGWWKDGLISDSDFVSGIQWLISNGIMKIS